MNAATATQISAAYKQGVRHRKQGRTVNPHRDAALAQAWRSGFYGVPAVS